MGAIAKEALKLFYQKFGRRIIKTVADSKWVANMIQKLKSKTSTQKIADKVREGIKKDRPFEGFTPKIVPKTKIVPKKPDPLGDILQGKPYIDKQGRSWGFQKVPTPKGLKKSNVIPFPKKPPHLKADGGSIDKALPKRSRDI